MMLILIHHLILTQYWLIMYKMFQRNSKLRALSLNPLPPNVPCHQRLSDVFRGIKWEQWEKKS